MKYSTKFVKLLKSLELIIIDEISMVRADIIDFIDRLLRHYCRNPREPFAGKQLLLVGDLFQLEPVVTADMKLLLHRYYPNAYFSRPACSSRYLLCQSSLPKCTARPKKNSSVCSTGSEWVFLLLTTY